MRTPTIHLNGTSRSELGRMYMEALEAVTAALRAAEQSNPNGRDYYPQGDSALGEAIREHDARLQRLRTVRDEYAALYESVEA